MGVASRPHERVTFGPTPHLIISIFKILSSKAKGKEKLKICNLYFIEKSLPYTNDNSGLSDL